MSDEAEPAARFGSDAISRPDGTQRKPARTCKHLFESQPTFADGTYWIDPNGGRLEDAIQARCLRASKQTCFSAKQIGGRKQWVAKQSDKHGWFSAKNSEFAYTVEGSQLTYLQMWSLRATQKIAIECSAMPVVSGAEKPVQFRTDSGRTLTRFNRKLGYSVELDDCQYGKSSWAETVVTFDTRASRLPIRDIGLVNAGQFGIKLREVCFS